MDSGREMSVSSADTAQLQVISEIEASNWKLHMTTMLFMKSSIPSLEKYISASFSLERMNVNAWMVMLMEVIYIPAQQ